MHTGAASGLHIVKPPPHQLERALQAPMDGEVVAVNVGDEEAVEYDQVLFEMRPAMASSGSRIK